MRNNKAEQERVAGTPVLYGNTIQVHTNTDCVQQSYCTYVHIQLLHLFSGKYVAVDLVEISKTESINLQVLPSPVYNNSVIQIAISLLLAALTYN